MKNLLSRHIHFSYGPDDNPDDTVELPDTSGDVSTGDWADQMDSWGDN